VKPLLSDIGTTQKSERAFGYSLLSVRGKKKGNLDRVEDVSSKKKKLRGLRERSRGKEGATAGEKETGETGGGGKKNKTRKRSSSCVPT